MYLHVGARQHGHGGARLEAQRLYEDRVEVPQRLHVRLLGVADLLRSLRDADAVRQAHFVMSKQCWTHSKQICLHLLYIKYILYVCIYVYIYIYIYNMYIYIYIKVDYIVTLFRVRMESALTCGVKLSGFCITLMST